MAKNETKRLRPVLVSEDTDAFAALKNLVGYAPANPAYDVVTGNSKLTVMNNLRDTEAQAEAAYKAARDNANAAEWDFHNFMLGAKSQVIAQYGDSSNELQSLGLKKKTEYKSPSKKQGGA